ncbi:MAG: hydantoinase B/oxoprolinase family protein [Bdellovibrio sp.]|jgi:N-methylhydantoinase B
MLKGLTRETYDHFLSSCLKPWESSALLTLQGEILSLRYETLSDVGTLPQAGRVALQYLKVGPGDLVVLNDPFSGGNLLSNLTLIYGMEHECSGLILVVRTGFRARLNLGERLDEEGLRIPPTPLAQKGQWMEPLLQALVTHPDAPAGAENRLRGLFTQMQAMSQRLTPPTGDWTPYLNECKQETLAFLAEIPHGETKVEQRLAGGELLRLNIEVGSENVTFDFSGTSPSKKIGLTDAAVQGACFGALVAYFQMNLGINESSFSMLQVSAPLGSWLNSKYPTPTFRGMTEGVHRVAHLVWQALTDLASQASVAPSPSSPTWLSLQFADGQMFFDSLPVGVGAHLKSGGAAALHLWVRSPIVNSVEQIESKFPIRILQAGPRKGSGGDGASRGGDGMVKVYELLKPAYLQWIQSTLDVKGFKGGEGGQSSLVKINEPSKAQVLKSEVGALDLPAGTLIEVLTAGGGGYGKIRPPA